MPSSRRSKQLIPQHSLVKVTGSGYTSCSYKFVSQAHLTTFINQVVSEGLQVITVAVPPCKHTLLVDVQPTAVVITDWNGSDGYNSHSSSWAQYKQLLDGIANKFGRPLQFAPIHSQIYEQALEHANKSGGGGCSRYVFDTIQKVQKYSRYTV